MASGTVLRKGSPMPLCGDTIAIAGGGAVEDRAHGAFSWAWASCAASGVSSRLLLAVEG